MLPLQRPAGGRLFRREKLSQEQRMFLSGQPEHPCPNPSAGKAAFLSAIIARAALGAKLGVQP